MFFNRGDTVDTEARRDLRELKEQFIDLAAFVKQHMNEEEEDRKILDGRLSQIEKKQIYLGIAIAVILQQAFSGLPLVDLIMLLK